MGVVRSKGLYFHVVRKLGSKDVVDIHFSFALTMSERSAHSFAIAFILFSISGVVVPGAEMSSA